jgi:hypothetical protein
MSKQRAEIILFLDSKSYGVIAGAALRIEDGRVWTAAATASATSWDAAWRSKALLKVAALSSFTPSPLFSCPNLEEETRAIGISLRSAFSSVLKNGIR